MKLVNTLIVILVLLVSGCTSGLGNFASSRLPDERSTTSGVLVIATEATNRTRERFAYYYSFVSDSRPDFQINIRLWETRRVAVIPNMVPGQYTFTGIKVVSEPTQRIKTFVAPDIRQMKHPVSFSIRPGAITVLDYGVVATQVYPDGFRLEEIRQIMQVKKLNSIDRNLVLQELSREGNLAAWQIVDEEANSKQLPEVVYTDSSKAFIRTFLNKFDDW